MMGAMMYSSMFAISVLGLSTLKAGAYSLFMVLGMMITANLSGQLVNRTGYRFWLILGPIITIFGLLLMSRLTVDTKLSYCALCLFVFGFGLGCMMAIIMTAVQNSSKESEIGMTTSAVNLIRSIGSTIGTAIFTVVINNKIASELSENLPPFIYDMVPHDTGVLGYVAYLPQYAYDILLSFANSVDFAFICGAVLFIPLLIIGAIYKVCTPEPEE